MHMEKNLNPRSKKKILKQVFVIFKKKKKERSESPDEHEKQGMATQTALENVTHK